MTAVSHVGVLGCGLMGSGIAETVARAGPDVLVVEAGPAALDAGRRRIEASLDRAVRRSRLTGDERDRALARLSFSTDLGDLADRDLVVEAAVEDRDLKCALFRDVDKVLGDGDAILASNTSSIPLTDLATVTGRPDRVVGLHFFNPVPVQALVEIIPALTTGADTVERVRRFAVEQLGKTAVQAPDRAGFIVNALLLPYLLSAVRMVQSGTATAEDIDHGMELGCAHPMGPLRLLDLIGLDTAQAIAESLYEEHAEPLYAPPPLLRRMVAAGRLGRKSGQGFYAYPAA
ncbi:3-hydroxybutyryl-CoA dehydrogenase [Streptomyces griseiscabiei]|uniref:3-hydroxybutyryl-CoA dehydrogenase n=2 Tax=Streptomyces griseiscabiei TaxID=2993540 RepID=A0ABU4L2E6_9ACTN|nr:3-hydroxybutyryl-CoA dehydrogenase [Streptomyces griseiscabiei]MBZ3901531.1 3-hydroxybutyryl-CoA dehydrogenase [Streptomyces griseiscabiei]MDX2909919.1 3-hydroxybutyryl-CoA dehydrogenase [Streptomyces griseiscabiei]